ncbi:hypothetical protein HC256_007020 [Beauveria bassiana]|nr:hypothetical protein HC256_007020 [Beauveria bassiana]
MSWKIWTKVTFTLSWFEPNDVLTKLKVLFNLACLVGGCLDQCSHLAFIMGYIIATSRLVPELVLSSDTLNTHPGAADRKLPRACQGRVSAPAYATINCQGLAIALLFMTAHCHQPQAPGVSLKGHSFVGETHHVRKQLGAKKEEDNLNMPCD